MSREKQVSGLRAFGFVYGFARPHLLPYVVGLLLYTSQQVLFAALNATLLGGVTSAMLNGSLSGLLTTGLTVLAFLLLMAALLYPGVLMYAVGGLKTTRRLQTKIFPRL